MTFRLFSGTFAYLGRTFVRRIPTMKLAYVERVFRELSKLQCYNLDRHF